MFIGINWQGRYRIYAFTSLSEAAEFAALFGCNVRPYCDQDKEFTVLV